MVCGKRQTNLQTPITFLLPCANFISDIEQSHAARISNRLFHGVSDVAYEHNYRVETVPVSLTNNYLDIDWTKLEHLDSGSMVMVSASWYHKLFPLLHERGCKVALIDDQTSVMRAFSGYFKNWFLIETKRAESLCSGVQYMKNMGQKRIALVHNDLSEKDHPVLRGYLSGLEKCALDYSAWMEAPDEPMSAIGVIGTIFDFYQKNKFDTLFTSSSFLFPLRYQPFLNKTLGIPDSVKILLLENMDHLFNTYPPPCRIDFPWEEMGRYGARALIKALPCQKHKSFDATIIIRDMEDLELKAIAN
jgi:DNA-binding LacI/PurR family transcriptional regulator